MPSTPYVEHTIGMCGPQVCCMPSCATASFLWLQVLVKPDNKKYYILICKKERFRFSKELLLQGKQGSVSLIEKYGMNLKSSAKFTADVLSIKWPIRTRCATITFSNHKKSWTKAALSSMTINQIIAYGYFWPTHMVL